MQKLPWAIQQTAASFEVQAGPERSLKWRQFRVREAHYDNRTRAGLSEVLREEARKKLNYVKDCK